jgi:hypothetical protein
LLHGADLQNAGSHFEEVKTAWEIAFPSLKLMWTKPANLSQYRSWSSYNDFFKTENSCGDNGVLTKEEAKNYFGKSNK